LGDEPVDDYDTPDYWYQNEDSLFDALIGGHSTAGDDAHLQELFDKALFDPDVADDERAEAYDELVDYLWDEYEIDFEDVFDWEDYRSWYDAA
jgi:hypothetical protein